LCHGSAGLALIFARGAALTGDSSLADAARFWVDDTLQRVAGCDDSSLLNGLAGAGLALLALSGDHEPAWDRALLLS
jgi:hypothetical protein